MYVAKRGKMAPKRERRKVFAAIAEAALEERERALVSLGGLFGRVGAGAGKETGPYNMR